MSRIRDVWATNLEQEMRVIRAMVERYPYIAMVWGLYPRARGDTRLTRRTCAAAGHRVPRRRCAARRLVSLAKRLPLPDHAL